jgi:polyketide cyclase/dehydrase/lipid transport protein
VRIASEPCQRTCYRVVICSAAIVMQLAVTMIDGQAVEAPMLDIAEEPSGGFRAKAILHIPASPATVRAVLTDYERWPDLFAGRFRVTRLKRESDRVITDLLIKRFPLPGEMRLLCETRERPDGGLVTSLIEGDFTRYVRQWTLTPEPNSPDPQAFSGTRAEMDLSLQLKSWVPDWLLIANLRGQLLEHFRILREQAIQRTAR